MARTRQWIKGRVETLRRYACNTSARYSKRVISKYTRAIQSTLNTLTATFTLIQISQPTNSEKNRKSKTEKAEIVPQAQSGDSRRHPRLHALHAQRRQRAQTLRASERERECSDGTFFRLMNDINIYFKNVNKLEITDISILNFNCCFHQSTHH